ncbi:MAG: translocase FtsK, partial [Chloroflexota bacterium]|nr:translocase FtsK [Chloroflexota bacterium]
MWCNTMAKRSPRRGKSQPRHGPDLGQLLRGELVGSILVVAAFLLMLSMLSANRGMLTGALIGAMQTLFGVTAWAAPILLAALGAWLALRAISDQHILTLQRLIGLLGLFLISAAVAYLFVGGEDPFAGQGGGLLGYLIGQGLVMILGAPIAIAGLALGGFAALLALSGVSLVQLEDALREGWRQLRGAAPGPEGVRRDGVNRPPLPLGESLIPWRRWWRNLRERFSA